MKGQYPPGGTGIVVLVIAVVMAVVLGVMGLRGTRTETEFSDAVNFDPERHGALGAMVVSKRESGGFSFLGIRLKAADRTVSVMLLAPADCSPVVAYGQTWPVAAAECQTPWEVRGTIEGLGTAVNGETIIGVAIPVSRECYVAASLGAIWPPAGCTEPG